MGKQLIVAEKPSAAKSIAAALGAEKRGDGYIEGDGCVVSHCVGHLLELAAPKDYDEKYEKWRIEDLPIVPQKWRHVVSEGKADRLKVLKDLMNRPDVECVVNACDAGREGELIFRLVLEHANCEKPVKRLWIGSMEDAAIKAGFANLKDGAEYDDLYAAALCREKADWLVGISATRLFSVLYGVTLNTGRVQSPTLALLVKREAEIADFASVPFFVVKLDCGDFSASGERMSEKAAAGRVAESVTSATVTAVARTEKTAKPPKLHDLTTLQREANRAFGFTAGETLEYVQSLYEKKLVTYPRTDSRFLTDDMTAGAARIVRMIEENAPCDAAGIADSSKVTDHHAIIPTAEGAKADVSALPPGEREILETLKTRLVCAVGEDHEYSETVVTLEAGGATFTAKGKTVTRDGWKSFAGLRAEGEDEADARIPENVAEGVSFPASASVSEGATSPPKRYDDDTLLAAMETAGAEDMPDGAERKGLGTPATRAAVIDKLVAAGFATRRKKSLIPTDKGKNLVAVLPTALASAKMTAEWEHKLLLVRRGELAADEFMTNITAFAKSVVLSNASPNPELASLFPSERGDAPELGTCPRCGLPVREGAKGFFCDGRECGFKIWKESKFWTAKKTPPSAAVITALLKDGRVFVKGLHSEKTGKKYDATVVLDDSGDRFVNFKLEFKSGKEARS